MNSLPSACLAIISDIELNMSLHKKLLKPYEYIQSIPGKKFRSKLIKAFDYWLQVSENNLQAIVDIIEILHNASLLIDDIQDNSVLRRGIPVAHSIYGVASTINAATYATIFALAKITKLGHPQAIQVYLEQLMELHEGQGMEIYWRDNFTCPSEEQYKEMTIKKTGGLFKLAFRLMQLFSENKSDCRKLSEILGLYFQIRDDYCNLTEKEYTKNKSYCEDLTEGKFSFPIIHALKNQDGSEVLHILRQRPREVHVKKYCVSLLERFGSLQYTRNILETLEEQARKEVTRLGGNPLLEDLLDELLSWRGDEKDNHLDADMVITKILSL